MRRRWHVSSDFLGAVGAVWLFGGMIAWMVSMALWNGCDSHGCGMNADHFSTVGIVGLCLWVGPFALLLAGALIVGAAYALWTNRPRRVTESAPDIREVYRDAK